MGIIYSNKEIWIVKDPCITCTLTFPHRALGILRVYFRYDAVLKPSTTVTTATRHFFFCVTKGFVTLVGKLIFIE